MTEMDSEKLDELLSCYVDDELSDRRRTEVKRLMEHDPTIVEKLASLKAMKALLNELPIEQSPADMFELTKVSLERKCILDDYAVTSGEMEGARHLRFRRLATAAIILVLFGSLVGVVVNIMSPSGSGGSDIAGFDPAVSPGRSVPAAATIDNFANVPARAVFSAAIDLATSDPIQMNLLLTKALDNNDLLGSAEPPKPDDPKHTTMIQCSKSQLLALLSDLNAEWDRCDHVTLVVNDDRMGTDIVVDNVTCAQVMGVFKHDEIKSRIELARKFSDFNKLATRDAINSSYAALPDGSAVDGDPTKLTPIRPEFTSGDGGRDNSGNAVDKEKINLMITITQLQ